ncbi:MAG: HAMP domain-containing sensor histidine kinase [Balneolales bacterium]
MIKYQHIRWIFLGIGLSAVVGLTGMNVYSLYALHENTVQSSVEKQKRQLLEYTNQVRNRFRYPLNDLWQVDMQNLHTSLQVDGKDPSRMPEELLAIIRDAYADRLFSEIYFSLPDCSACDQYGSPIWHYNPLSGRMEETTQYTHLISDGLAIAKTRTNALVHEYRWSTRVVFDTHNSMTIALINLRSREIVGYLCFLVDSDYLINNYIGPKLIDTFGYGGQNGIVVWLHDWTKNEVLSTTHSGTSYSYQKVDFIQNFPDLLNDWNLKASFTNIPEITASQETLYRNLAALGGGVVLLIGVLVFMFFTAQRERSLAERQSLFLANVTHELKTPLSVILAAGENLSDGRVVDKKRLHSYGAHIYSESMRLRSMIDRLLDIARSNSDQIHLKKEWVDLAELIRGCIDNKRTFIDSNNVKVHVETDKNVPKLFLDPTALTSIMNNLIDNAIHYSPNKKYLAIRLLRHGQKIMVEVEDHGTGIPRKAQKHVFDKFFRVEDAMTAQTKGHGLGLAIVKDLTVRNGGTVTVKSTQGKGSVFILTFPVSETGENISADRGKTTI